MDDARPDRPARRVLKPLDARQLDELALSYVARFATSAGKLSDYLKRKLRERGWGGEDAPDVDAVVARMVARRYVDDAVFARVKGQGLLRRGYGARRIGQALGAAGIDERTRCEGLGSGRERREAALVLARKRRFGPFGRDGGCHDPATREKQVAAMLRAGHPLASARAMVDAGSIEEAESWVDEDVD